MWTDTAVANSDSLRQGDLLESLLMPQAKLPLTIAHPVDREPDEKDLALCKLEKKKYYLVVSQCCTVENYKVAALAPVVRVAARTPEAAEPYMLEKPPEDASGPQYSYAAHGILPTPDGHPPAPPEGTIYVADFSKIQTYAGDLNVLVDARVARMTPLSRLSLRYRLSAFWGRPEKEDEDWLASNSNGAG